MKYSTQIKDIVEERYQLCIWLKHLSNKSPHKWGLFAQPCHIKGLFGDFLKTPLYSEIATLEGHTNSVDALALHENILYSGSRDKTIRVWKIGELESNSKKRKRELNFNM